MPQNLRLKRESATAKGMAYSGSAARFFVPDVGEILLVARDVAGLQAVMHEMGQVLNSEETGAVLVFPGKPRDASHLRVVEAREPNSELPKRTT